VNAAAADLLRQYVINRVRALDPRTIVDAYSGIGDTAIALASADVKVTAIELDAEAIAWTAARLHAPSVALHGKVEDLLCDVLPADVVLLNPPRAGLDARVAEVLQANASAIRGIVYVSCNPATLGRDLSRLPDYAIGSIRAFDMFPQTAHVETVCELKPAVGELR
jgi:23S rRNA (uracil1939-C5)-methyltransferase